MVLFALVWFTPLNNTNVNALNEVPAFYYANYKFIKDWDEMWSTFDAIKSRDSLNKSIPSSYYTELLTHFNNSFPYLTEEFKSTYNNCRILPGKNLWQRSRSSARYPAACSIHAPWSGHADCRLRPGFPAGPSPRIFSWPARLPRRTGIHVRRRFSHHSIPSSARSSHAPRRRR